jgi:hypothetical protein
MFLSFCPVFKSILSMQPICYFLCRPVILNIRFSERSYLGLQASDIYFSAIRMWTILIQIRKVMSPRNVVSKMFYFWKELFPRIDIWKNSVVSTNLGYYFKHSSRIDLSGFPLIPVWSDAYIGWMTQVNVDSFVGTTHS